MKDTEVHFDRRSVDLALVNAGKFNYVLIIDSLQPGDPNSARRLHEDIDLLMAANPPTPGADRKKIETKADLFALLSNVERLAIEEQLLPLLHFECHGNEDGIQLADGSPLAWKDLKPYLTAINVATKLNLMVVMSSCSGGGLTQSLELSDRAPVWGLIGPTRAISFGESEAHFGAFYREMFRTASPAAGVNALNKQAEEGLYWRTTAEGFFYAVWNAYKTRLFTPEQLERRAVRMQKRAAVLGRPVLSKSEMLQKLIKSEPDSFDAFRNKFFMIDLFPHHMDRFDVTYEKAEGRRNGG